MTPTIVQPKMFTHLFHHLIFPGDQLMRKFTLFLSILLLISSTACQSKSTSGTYGIPVVLDQPLKVFQTLSMSELSSHDLRFMLHASIRNHYGFTYAQLWDELSYTDDRKFAQSMLGLWRSFSSFLRSQP